MAIISHKWSGAIAKFSWDDSPFGLVTTLTLKCAHQTLMIVGSYWPCKSDNVVDDTTSETTGSLWHRVAHWQNSFTPKRPGSPLEYVQSAIAKKTYQHVSQLRNSALLLVFFTENLTDLMLKCKNTQGNKKDSLGY